MVMTGCLFALTDGRVGVRGMEDRLCHALYTWYGCSDWLSLRLDGRKGGFVMPYTMGVYGHDWLSLRPHRRKGWCAGHGRPALSCLIHLVWVFRLAVSSP